jgi:hypothetical protein
MNQVLIGNYFCPVISSTTTQIICKIGFNSGLTSGSIYYVDVRIRNFGFAIKNTTYLFQFLPIITLITPNTG